MQGYYRVNIYFFDISVLVVFGLPVLEIASLIAASLRVSHRTERIVRVGRFLLPVLMINAAWRIFEYIQSHNSCETTSGGDFEAFCDTVGFQVFVHVLFLILGAIALFLFLRKIDISHLYKKWAFVIGAVLLLRVGMFVPGYFPANIYFFDIDVLLVSGLPVLEIVSLIAASLRVSYRTERIVRVGQFLLPVLMINAAWQIFEYIPLYNSCVTMSGGDFEALCGTVWLQVFVHVPFLFLGAIALFRFHRKVG